MERRTCKIIADLMVVMVLVAVGCDLGLIQGNTGSLAIDLGSSSRNLVWEPELDMDIASYTIKQHSELTLLLSGIGKPITGWRNTNR